MKTKQEQIEKMMLDVPQTIAAYDANPKGQHLYGEQRLQIAEILYDKGYGDVSEYKAEIERLKEKNNELNKERWSLEEELKKKELEITYARNNGYEKGYDECEEYTKGKIEQAKINILRELKERIETAIDTYYNSDEEGEGYFIAEDAIKDIDELIKEVQNENQH